MPDQRTKFSEAWLSGKDANGDTVGDWCQKGKNEYHGYCRYCLTNIKCDNGGRVQLLKHCSNKKHKDLMKHAKDRTQVKLTFRDRKLDAGAGTSSQTTLTSLTTLNNATVEAEIFWLAKMACSNFSFRSSDTIGHLFQAMFPDSEIAKSFSLGHTKASYIIGEGMLPYFTEVFVNDLKKSDLPFSVHFDETTTSQVKKQMDITLRYWSQKHEEVWSLFYTSLFFGHADGETVAKAMYSKMVEDGLPVDQMATLVRDGPNVNKTIFRNMNKLIQEDHPQFTGLVDLGSCTIHTVHNAFNKGMEQHGREIDQLCVDLFSLLKYSAARREDFKAKQIEMDLEVVNFIQHTEVRWLSIGPAVQRVLEQWDAICAFVSDLAKDPKKVPKSVNYKRLYSMLGTKENAVTRVSVEFLHNCISVFEQFLLLFQKSAPVIHILYDSLCGVLMKLMRQFIQTMVLENVVGSELTKVNCKDVKLQLSDKDLNLGSSTRKALKELSPDQQRKAFLGMRAFFQATTSYLQDKLPLNNQLLKQLQCLNPSRKKEEFTASAIASLSSVLQPNVNQTEVVDEWKLFQVDTELPEYNAKERIEVFWNALFQLQSPSGDPRYKVLPCVLKSALILTQTNAESERSLSVNARIVAQDRASLSERTIVGLHIVKEAVRFFDPVSMQPEHIPVDAKLKQAVRSANASYKERLQREKELERRTKNEKRDFREGKAREALVD